MKKTMKMKTTDYDELKDAMYRRMRLCESRKEYEDRGLSAKRHRWDMLWGSGYSITPLYSYLNDDHIDTALRRIVREYEQSEGPGLRESDKANFNTLCKARDNGDLALMDCRRKADGAKVAMVCAVAWDGETYNFTPLAVMVEGNPYELFDPPGEDDQPYQAIG